MQTLTQSEMSFLQKTIVLLALFILPRLMYAQDYQTVRSDRVVSFENKLNNDLKFLRIDSVLVNQSDSVFYPFFNIRSDDAYCYTPYGSSWIGEKVIIRQDGYNLFFNKNGDTIKINTRAQLNNTWVCYNARDTIIVAKVISHDTMGFLGLKDSVKEISFQVFDTAMNVISVDLNGLTIQISKNYGLVRTLNFYKLFIYFGRVFLYDNYFTEYNLAGISIPGAGSQNLTWFGVFDFHPGDQIHIEEAFYSSGPGYYYSYSNRTIEKYIERKNQNDSIIYIIAKTISINFQSTDTATFKYSHDTIVSVIIDNHYFNLLPGEPATNDLNNILFTYSMNTNYPDSKIKPQEYNILSKSYDSCYYPPNIFGCYAEHSYLKGLGGPYYYCNNDIDNGWGLRKLVYYKKGNITWGTPLVITGIEGHKKPLKAKVFPNPSNGQIWIETETTALPLIFELIDLHGRTLLIKEINSGYFSVDTGPYPSGIYLYQLQDKNGRVGHGKLILE
jgi:type IX secretion system substrate protein